MEVPEIIKKFEFWLRADRIGPDVPFSQWRLYIKSWMVTFAKKKLYKFADTSDIRPGAYLVGCSNISIGERVVIRPNTMLFAETLDLTPSIIIENDVMIGSGVHIYVSNHAFSNGDLPIIDQGHSPSLKVTLKKGCWIGANCIILPGVTIGENAVIGAGSIVTKSIPPRTLAVGNPARVIKYL